MLDSSLLDGSARPACVPRYIASRRSGSRLASDREDWHDVRVVELGHCLRLDAEPLQFQRVERRDPGEDLERDPTPQRDLLGLVDDPHPSAADLTHEPILAENRIRRQCILSRRMRGSRDGRCRR